MLLEVGEVRNRAADADEEDVLHALEGAQESGRGATGRDVRVPAVAGHGQLRCDHSVRSQITQCVNVGLT